MLQCYKDTKYKKKKKIRSKRTNNNNKKHNYQCVDYSLLKEYSIWAQARKKKKEQKKKKRNRNKGDTYRQGELALLI